VRRSSSSSIHHHRPSSHRSNIDTHISSSSSTAIPNIAVAVTEVMNTSRFRSIDRHYAVNIDDDNDNYDNEVSSSQHPTNSDDLLQQRIQDLIRNSMTSGAVTGAGATTADLDEAFQSFMYGTQTMNNNGGGVSISDHLNQFLSNNNDTTTTTATHRRRHQDVYDENGIRLPDPVQRQQLLGGSSSDDPLSFLRGGSGHRSYHHHRSRSDGSHRHDNGDDEDDNDEMMVFARADDPSVDWMFPTPRHISYQRSFEEVYIIKRS